MFHNFLYNYTPRKHLEFTALWPNAHLMYERATQHPCPTGIVATATTNWNATATRRFYGHTYTSPTPKAYTQQKLGLVIVKALALHLRNATRKMGKRPPTSTPQTTHLSPPGIEHNSDNSPFAATYL